MKIEKQSIIKREGKTFRNTGFALAFTALIGGAYLNSKYGEPSDSMRQSPMPASSENSALVKKMNAEALELRRGKLRSHQKESCDYLDQKNQSLTFDKINQKYILRRIRTSLECIILDVNSFEQNHKDVCGEMSVYLKTHLSEDLNTRLHPLYVEMYAKICDVKMEEVKDVNFRKTLQDLKDNLEIKLPVLDSEKKLQDLCKPGLEFFSENQEGLKKVVSYLILNRDKFVKGGALEIFINRAELKLRNKKEKGETKNEDTLETVILKGVAKGALSSRVIWGICSLPLESAFKMAKGIFKFELTLEEIQNRRKEFPFLLKELLEIAINDKTEKGQEIQNVLLNLGEELAKIK